MIRRTLIIDPLIKSPQSLSYEQPALLLANMKLKTTQDLIARLEASSVVTDVPEPSCILESLTNAFPRLLEDTTLEQLARLFELLPTEVDQQRLLTIVGTRLRTLLASGSAFKNITDLLFHLKNAVIIDQFKMAMGDVSLYSFTANTVLRALAMPNVASKLMVKLLYLFGGMGLIAAKEVSDIYPLNKIKLLPEVETYLGISASHWASLINLPADLLRLPFEAALQCLQEVHEHDRDGKCFTTDAFIIALQQKPDKRIWQYCVAAITNQDQKLIFLTALGLLQKSKWLTEFFNFKLINWTETLPRISAQQQTVLFNLPDFFSLVAPEHQESLIKSQEFQQVIIDQLSMAGDHQLIKNMPDISLIKIIILHHLTSGSSASALGNLSPEKMHSCLIALRSLDVPADKQLFITALKMVAHLLASNIIYRQSHASVWQYCVAQIDEQKEKLLFLIQCSLLVSNVNQQGPVKLESLDLAAKLLGDYVGLSQLNLFDVLCELSHDLPQQLILLRMENLFSYVTAPDERYHIVISKAFRQAIATMKNLSDHYLTDCFQALKSEEEKFLFWKEINRNFACLQKSVNPGDVDWNQIFPQLSISKQKNLWDTAGFVRWLPEQYHETLVINYLADNVDKGKTFNYSATLSDLSIEILLGAMDTIFSLPTVTPHPQSNVLVISLINAVNQELEANNHPGVTAVVYSYFLALSQQYRWLITSKINWSLPCYWDLGASSLKPPRCLSEQLDRLESLKCSQMAGSTESEKLAEVTDYFELAKSGSSSSSSSGSSNQALDQVIYIEDRIQVLRNAQFEASTCPVLRALQKTAACLMCYSLSQHQRIDFIRQTQMGYTPVVPSAPLKELIDTVVSPGKEGKSDDGDNKSDPGAAASIATAVAVPIEASSAAGAGSAGGGSAGGGSNSNGQDNARSSLFSRAAALFGRRQDSLPPVTAVASALPLTVVTIACPAKDHLGDAISVPTARGLRLT